MAPKYWLMKAEPDSRIVKGKDVKFSVDDFEAIGVTPWEGVRNAEARNLMKEMALGDKVLFYHSNCKNPGIAAFAEISKEAYPDYTAWDSDHPYFDLKTDKDNPKWFMVDVTFRSRLDHFVPLSFLRSIAELPSDADPPGEVTYLGKEGVKVIQEMALVKRGRLSVQRVAEEVWPIMEQLGKRGGWEETVKAKTKPSKKASKRGKKKEAERDSDEDNHVGKPDVNDKGGSSGVLPETEATITQNRRSNKRKGAPKEEEEEEYAAPLRRSTRTRR